MSRHQQQPLQLGVGGGDQLYNDDLWRVPSLKNCTQEQNRPGWNEINALRCIKHYSYLAVLACVSRNCALQMSNCSCCPATVDNRRWCAYKDREERNKQPFSQEMINEVGSLRQHATNHTFCGMLGVHAA
eukprot:scaffold34493_cov22-Tisochrysis_lutea.AAC.1